MRYAQSRTKAHLHKKKVIFYKVLIGEVFKTFTPGFCRFQFNIYFYSVALGTNHSPIMNIDFSEKPKVSVHLDVVHEAYCRYIFSTPRNQKEIIATRTHPIGQRLTAITDKSTFLKKNPSVKGLVVFILPIDNVNHYHRKRSFLKVSECEKQKFNDYVRSEFSLWVREEFYRGYEIFRWDQKTIVSTICRKLDVRNNSANSGTITKNDYRNRVYVEKYRAKLLENL